MLSFVPLDARHKIWCLANRILLALAICQLIPFTSAAAEREPYDDRYCTTCHGTDGRGNEGIEAPRLAGMEDWYLRRQLENFRAGIRGYHPMDTAGIAMRPMAKLTDDSIADIVAWVGSWDYQPAEITIEVMCSRVNCCTAFVPPVTVWTPKAMRQWARRLWPDRTTGIWSRN